MYIRMLLVEILLLTLHLDFLDTKRDVPAFGPQRYCGLQQTFCTVGLCLIPACDECTAGKAVCRTSNVSEPVPLALPPDTSQIDIHYIGPPVTLSSQMFDKFVGLNILKISGSIQSLEPGAFGENRFLKVLELSNTLITRLPNNLFHDMSRLGKLSLPNNKLDAIPENVFHQIRQVTSMDLSYNPIDIGLCHAETVGEGFRWLSKLAKLSLAGIQECTAQNCTVNDNFLSPLANIQYLDFSESCILQSNEALVRSLDGVNALTINNMDIYKYCPAKANSLFQNLPVSINKINAESWKTEEHITKECLLSSTSFKRLRQATTMSLNFRYSDGILGDKVTPDLFTGLPLVTLDLTWCRISSIQEGALDEFEHLSALGLGGNHLDIRRLLPFTNSGSGHKLKKLNLDSIGLFSDEKFVSNMGYILQQSPHITELILDRNLLKKLPQFSLSSKGNAVSYRIRILRLNENKLTSLSQNATDELCRVMPSLLLLTARNNMVSDISGVCITITRLDIGNNFIGENVAENFMAVRNLVNLTRFDAPRNGIGWLLPDLLKHMPHLEGFMVGGNEIKHIPPDFFSNNPNLKLIDFSANELLSLDKSMFTFSEKIAAIYLQGNLINSVSLNTTQRLSSLAKKELWMLNILGNPLDCSCDTLYLQQWFQGAKFIANVRNLSCQGSDPNRVGDKVYNYTYTPYYCIWRIPILVAGTMLLAMILSSPLGICIYRHWWYLCHIRVVVTAMIISAKKVKREGKSRYDAFVSYDSENEEVCLWITESMIPELEMDKENGRVPAKSVEGDNTVLYIRERDSLLGCQRYTETCQAVEDSRKLIILLSNSYLANNSCLNEANLIAESETEGSQFYRPDRILILVLEEPDDEVIRPPITGLLKGNVIDVTQGIRKNTRKMKSVWNRVHEFLAKPRFVYRKKPRKNRQTRKASRYGSLGETERDQLCSSV